MKLSRGTIILSIFCGVLLVGCDARKNLVGKWKIVSINVKKNRVVSTAEILVFDPEGYITFNTGKAARGQWEITPSNKTLSIFLYGKALQHDVSIIGVYDFSSDRLTISDPKDDGKVLIELEKIEEEPSK